MANLYSPQQVGINQSNLQNGGWYNSRQYWNGMVGDPGVIINPTQQGTGKPVSNDVIAQTNPANVGYVQQQQQKQQQNPVQPSGQTAPIAPSSGGDGGASAGTGSGVGFTPPATINLPQLYQSLYQSEGISDLEKGINDKTQAFNDAQSKINDNPFLSESNRVGRVQKLSTDFQNSIKSDQDTLAMKRADIQTRLDLETKQFDINSQSAQQAFSQFQSLLSSGALDNASGQDIANITQATGLSSSMIQSAIAATKAKNTPSQVIQFDDGTNQGFAVINPQTGEIIKKQVVTNSKPSASGGGSVLNEQRSLDLEKAQAPQVLLEGAKQGKTLDDMIAYGVSQGMSANDIYKIYQSINYYHTTSAQQKADKKKYGIK